MNVSIGMIMLTLHYLCIGQTVSYFCAKVKLKTMI